jgi:hypothetical protein
VTVTVTDRTGTFDRFELWQDLVLIKARRARCPRSGLPQVPAQNVSALVVALGRMGWKVRVASPGAAITPSQELLW